jgi:F-type H+-transporting ATPase subunit epsilon
MKLEIVTPEGIAYADEVEMVTLTGVAGEMGVLPGHARLMTPLVPGELVARKGGQDELLAVGEGLVEITGDRVSILTDMAVSAASIDDAKTQEAIRRAEARLRERLSAEEIASTNAALARTLAQLRIRRRR